MTWKNPPPLIPSVKKPSKKITPEDLAKSGSEDGEQSALFCWAADNCGQYPQLKYLFSIPNGGQRNIIEATKFVATGLRKGVPDTCLPWPTALHHGCFIEMKVGKNEPTEEQDDWLTYLFGVGYHTAVCYSWAEARDVLINYMEGKL